MSRFLNRLRSLVGIAPKAPREGVEFFGFYSIYPAVFFYTLTIGLPLYIGSTYIEEYVGKDVVGIVFATGAVLGLILLTAIPPLLRKFGNRRIALFLLSAMIFALLGLAFSDHIALILLFFIINEALLPVIIFHLDLFLESFSQDAFTGSIRGYYLTLLNLAFFIAPFLAGLVMVGTNFSEVYLFSILFLLPVLFLVFFSLRTFQDPLYVDISFKDALLNLSARPNIRRVLSLRFLLHAFNIWIQIYLPIYLYTEVGISFAVILSIIIPVSLVPFLLVQIPLGKLADRLNNEKTMLVLGFIITSISIASLSFIETNSIVVWVLILFIAHTGSATIEVMSGTYFYKQVNASNVNLISMFRALWPAANIMAPLVATIALLFFAGTYQYLFLIFGIILLSGIPLAYKLDPTKSSLLDALPIESLD